MKDALTLAEETLKYVQLVTAPESGQTVPHILRGRAEVLLYLANQIGREVGRSPTNREERVLIFMGDVLEIEAQWLRKLSEQPLNAII